MKRFSISTLAPLLLTVALICMPLVSLAQRGDDQIRTQVQRDQISSQVQGEIRNPLKVSNFCDLVKIVLQAILIIGMPIAVVFLVLVGLKFVLAQGNPEKLKKAQENLLYTVIGIAIFLGAWAIAKVIATTLAALGASAVNECIR
jgi:uncharacterized membrane protein (GlpM family)